MEICIVHNIVHNYLHRIHLIVTNSFSYSNSTTYNTLNSHCRYSVAVSVTEPPESQTSTKQPEQPEQRPQ